VKITISGASGLIGRRLLKLLTMDGHSVSVLSRHAGMNMPGGVRVSVWDPMKGEPPAESLREADAVIHLAGEPVAQRWNEESKRRIRESRVTGTRNLLEALAKLSRRPDALICASAVGYYGSRGEEILEESSAPGSDFLADVCIAWEREAQAAEQLGIRAVQVRTGIVLDRRGGALKQMLPPFKVGVGGKLGSGQQWMSWIHHEDLAGIYRFALTNPLRGPVNGVAPQPVTNAEFTREMGQALKRPTIFPVPGFALRLLFGDMAEMLLGGQRALPVQAEAAGYRFRYPRLGPALAHVLRG
jgi:uncharacterized protein